MNVKTRNLIRITACTALLTMLTACDPPPPPGMIRVIGDNKCPGGTQMVAGESPEEEGALGLSYCAPTPPPGWEWETTVDNNGPTITGACNAVGYCVTY
jgi:hypothetical protein